LPAVVSAEADAVAEHKQAGFLSQRYLFYSSYPGSSMKQTPSCSTPRARQYCPTAQRPSGCPHLI